MIDDKLLKIISSFRYLGVFIDSQLSFKLKNQKLHQQKISNVRENEFGRLFKTFQNGLRF